MKNNYRSLLLFTVLLTAVNVTAYGQSFDYENRPVLKFDFLEADIDLNLIPSQAKVAGSVTYRLEANVTGADSLILYAPEVAVDSVVSTDKALNYSIENGRLSIALEDSVVSGNKYQVQIYYHTNPRFGLLKDSEGTIWTSVLPKSHRHWLPSPGHPRIEAVTTLTLTVPAAYSVAATGVKTDEEILGLKRKKVTFRSSKPIPVTSLAFAAGKFNREGTSYGIKRIITYAEENTIDASAQKQLTNKAQQIIAEIESVTEKKYPYQQVHIVVLNDHFWEQKSYGATVIFLYQNRGDLMNQLRRGLYAQWFGVFQHEGQWADAWPMQLFQSALHYKLTDEPANLRVEDVPETGFSTVYENYSVNRWNFWQRLPQWGAETQQIAAEIIPELLASGPGTLTPQQIENIWYSYSGRPKIDIPAFTDKINTKNTASEQSVYRVDFNLLNGSLELVFTAQKNAVEEPKTISLKIIDGGAGNVQKVTFGGAKDSVTVSIPAAVQNVLVAQSGEEINLKIHKPVPFILYQLDNAESVAVRKKAALQLGYHTENPDLQLALAGYLNKEMEPEVKAALLQSYALITNGATGTQQYFLEALSSPHSAVQKVALEALQNYPDNQKVTEQIRKMAGNPDSKLSAKALSVYMQRMDSTQVLGFVNTLVKQDTAGTKAITAIAKLAELGKTKAAVKRAKYYIQPVYSYPVRKKAFSVLLKYDNSTERWNKRLEMLLTDLDPRIRYLTIQNLSELPGVNREEVLQKYIPKAYDARIFFSIE